MLRAVFCSIRGVSARARESPIRVWLHSPVRECTESAPQIGWGAPELVVVLRLRGLQETSNQDLRTFRRSRRVEQLLSALSHLLPPHRAIETFARE